MSCGSKLHISPSNYHLLAAQQEPYKKKKKRLTLRIFWNKSQENGPLAEDRKSKRTRQKNKSGDRKGEPNDSPETPDWEKTPLDVTASLQGRGGWKAGSVLSE